MWVLIIISVVNLALIAFPVMSIRNYLNTMSSKTGKPVNNLPNGDAAVKISSTDELSYKQPLLISLIIAQILLRSASAIAVGILQRNEKHNKEEDLHLDYLSSFIRIFLSEIEKFIELIHRTVCRNLNTENRRASKDGGKDIRYKVVNNQHAGDGSSN